MIKQIGLTIVFLWACLQPVASGWAKENAVDSWPREISVPQGVVVIYQPQPEKLEGNQLKARAAVSVELKGTNEPVFGAVWFEARMDTDRAERTATIADVSVTQVRFPEQDDAKAKKLSDLLEKEIPKWQLPISMDRLLTTLELAQKRSEATKQIKTEPIRQKYCSYPSRLC
jgi:hypothetical protein